MRTRHSVEHVEFELAWDSVDGAWFSIHVPGDKRALFSGPIHPGMSAQVMRLGRSIKAIEDKITEQCEHCDGTGWIEVERMVRVQGEYQAYEPVGEQERCEHCNPLGV